LEICHIFRQLKIIRYRLSFWRVFVLAVMLWIFLIALDTVLARNSRIVFVLSELGVFVIIGRHCGKYIIPFGSSLLSIN